MAVISMLLVALWLKLEQAGRQLRKKKDTQETLETSFIDTKLYINTLDFLASSRNVNGFSVS